MSDASSDSDDEEYVPEGEGVGSASDEDVSDGDADWPVPVRSSKRNKKPSERRPSRTRSGSSGGGVQLTSRARVAEDDSDHSDSEDGDSGEGGEDGEGVEEEEKKSRIDDLWSSFKQDTGFTSRSAKPHPPPGTEGKGSECSETVTIHKTYDFAGESVTVEQQVSTQSKEGQQFLRSQQQQQQQQQPGSGAPVEEEEEEGEGPPPPLGSKRVSGLSNVLENIGSKKQKLSTLEKSKLDWDKYVKEAGLVEELAQNNKDSYLEKKEFLHRSDVRQFELEKEERLKRLRPLH